MQDDVFTLHRGRLPLLVSVPHDGTGVPPELRARLTPSARRVPDTDWHIARLYDFVRQMGASLIVPRHSRYVIDLNRGEDDVSLYPGQNTTGLCPVVQFSGEPVYLPGAEPDADEVRARIERWWRPYHRALADELQRLKAEHGRVLLWEGHSIRGELPFLFEGRLPDLNLGTAAGASCLPATQARIEAVLAAQHEYDHVSNGRFKGGHITRHYGRPAAGVEAVQLEISQRCYMDEASFEWNDDKAARLQPLLRRMLEAALGH
ncbi:N-formylglutamate deformylase [Luteimonas sp. e5]